MVADSIVIPAAGTDPRDPWTRLAALCDPHSLIPLHEPDESGTVAIHGRVGGAAVVVYCSDARRKGGAMTSRGCDHIVTAIDTAVEAGRPVIGLFHSAGASLADGVDALDGVGRVFAAMIRASGRVPQLSVVLGPAAGGAAYGPALTDLVIMAEDARIFVTGPDVVRSVTGEQIDMAALGGPDTHSRKSGVAHVVTGPETEALALARHIIGLLGQPGRIDPGAAGVARDLRALLPERARRAYDVHPVITAILDADPGGMDFTEFQPRWAPNIVVGIGRLCGRAIGVIANNPLRKGGCLDSLSAEKAARFVRMCDSFGLPLLVLVDVPGYLPGVGQEWDGVVRRGAKLLHAFGEASVPRVTLITRKCYGGAYIAMNSRALGATAVFAWPEAEIGIMGAEAAVNILHRKKLAAVADHERDGLRSALSREYEQNSGGVPRALTIGIVDEVIDPALTRQRVSSALAAATGRRGQHGNIPL